VAALLWQLMHSCNALASAHARSAGEGNAPITSRVPYFWPLFNTACEHFIHATCPSPSQPRAPISNGVLTVVPDYLCGLCLFFFLFFFSSSSCQLCFDVCSFQKLDNLAGS
jgi:hypothetical protein